MVLKMEMENITVLGPDEEPTATPAEEEVESVCLCEGQEVVTVCEPETVEEALSEEAIEETQKERIMRKCREVKEACSSTASRLVKDWKETAGNPYIKQTCTTRVDIYRNPDDETPVDTFSTEYVKGYSARSLAVLGAAALVVSCTVDCIMKKILK